MSAIPFHELIPMPLEKFFDEYKGKKPFTCTSNRNKFADHFTWQEFDNYLNGNGRMGHKRVPQLQIVNLNGFKYCHKKSKTKLSTQEIYKAWWEGHSFILTLSEFLNKTMWSQCEFFEQYYGIGQANIYCSSKKDAKCFPIHADSTDNFLFHVTGRIRWTVYNEFKDQCKPEETTVKKTFELDDGDLLYLPKGIYHSVETLSPRISISYHFHDAKGGRTAKREPWYDWIGNIPELTPKK